MTVTLLRPNVFILLSDCTAYSRLLPLRTANSHEFFVTYLPFVLPAINATVMSLTFESLHSSKN